MARVDFAGIQRLDGSSIFENHRFFAKRCDVNEILRCEDQRASGFGQIIAHELTQSWAAVRIDVCERFIEEQRLRLNRQRTR